MKEFILRSTDFQIRETKEGQDFVALEWRVATNKELMEDLKACGLTKYIARTKLGDEVENGEETE